MTRDADIAVFSGPGCACNEPDRTVQAEVVSSFQHRYFQVERRNPEQGDCGGKLSCQTLLVELDSLRRPKRKIRLLSRKHKSRRWFLNNRLRALEFRDFVPWKKGCM